MTVRSSVSVRRQIAVRPVDDDLVGVGEAAGVAKTGRASQTVTR